MKTAELIAALAQDLAPTPAGAVRRRMTLAVLGGAVLSGVLLLAWLGLRPLGEAVQTGSFWMKAAYTAVLSAAGLILAGQLARPGGASRPALLAIVAAVTVMAALGLAQVFVTAPGERLALWLGMTWNVCPLRILALAAPIFLGLLFAMRRLAPTRPAASGAAAGLAAGAVGATLYGLHCPEIAAAFVATWYTLGVAACAGVGALVGARLLRW